MENDLINELRKKIDSIDAELLNLLVKRKVISKQIGEYKRQKHLPIKDCNREEKLLNKLKIQAQALGLDEEMISNIFKLIIEDSVKIQLSLSE